MTSQIIFIITVVLTLLLFLFTTWRYVKIFRLIKPFKIGNWGKRLLLVLQIAIGQKKIFRFPFSGFIHAITFWGFLVILFGSIEMIFDGIFGLDKSLSFLGVIYEVIIAFGDIFAFLIMISIIIFIFRRLTGVVKRFSGSEMKHKSHSDAIIALSLILLLMVSLLGMNIFYLAEAKATGAEIAGIFPVSNFLSDSFSGISVQNANILYKVSWWSHILVIFLFINILPYSKHFHVFMSIPNVLLSRLEPLGYLPVMENVLKEVKMMLDPSIVPSIDNSCQASRFGVLDAEDVTWKNYLDSLTCTECGRCTSVCPANITGKKLSPRKVMMDLRARMKEKGLLLSKNPDFNDERSLIKNFTTSEELWACTTCNACAEECPVNINHPGLIVDMRRYLVMELACAPSGLNQIFTNIENNGAPWQYSREDRMKWAESLGFKVPLMSELAAQGKQADFLFWIGSSGCYDDRYKKATIAFVKILNNLGINYAVLGIEESDSGDAARRAGNEMLYQMSALMNIEILNGYGVKKIVTCCPHDFNTLKNEYCDFGGVYEVEHHSQFLGKLIKDGKLKINSEKFKNKRIVFHDPCYLGRGNGEYSAPRQVLYAMNAENLEMRRSKSFALCCGAGGGQMFKEAEAGSKEVFIERIEEALEVKPDIIATACPYCMVMITDGIKYKNQEENVKNLDIAEIVEGGMGL